MLLAEGEPFVFATFDRTWVFELAAERPPSSYAKHAYCSTDSDMPFMGIPTNPVLTDEDSDLITRASCTQ